MYSPYKYKIVYILSRVVKNSYSAQTKTKSREYEKLKTNIRRIFVVLKNILFPTLLFYCFYCINMQKITFFKFIIPLIFVYYSLFATIIRIRAIQFGDIRTR